MSLASLPPLSAFPPEYVAAYSGDSLRNVAIAFTVLAVMFLSLRYWSKIIGRNPFGADDWLMLGSLISILGMTASAFICINYAGVGHHLVVVAKTDPAKLVVWAKLMVAIPLIYAVAVTLPRLAILVFYLHIFRSGFARHATYAIMAIIIVNCIAIFLVCVLECIPLAYMWDKTIPGGYCININTWLRWAPLPNIITDVFMLVLPLPTVWKLQASRRTKMGVTVSLLTGSVGLIASILRTAAFFTHVAILDGPWATVVFVTWAIVEPGCYHIAACLICCRPLLKRVTGKIPDDLIKRTRGFNGFASLKALFPFSGRSTKNSNSGIIKTGEVHVELPKIPPVSKFQMTTLERSRFQTSTLDRDDRERLIV